VSDHPAALVVTKFLDAIVWGEHSTVWMLLSTAGRDHVLDAGSRRGLDAVQAERLRQGTSAGDELDQFLTGLLQGLRVDFAAVQLEEVEPVMPVEVSDDGRVAINLECPATFGDRGWAAGSVVLAYEGGSWLVDRVNPLVSRSE
jgi:hypothetical protein